MKKKHITQSAFFNLRAGICFALVCAVAVSTQANIITVVNTNDSGPGSLRQALAVVNDGDTINFDSALNGQIINLTSGELVLNNNITIAGPGADLLTVSRSSSNLFRIFHVMPGHAVIIEGLTIQNGSGSGGGGVLNDHATLTIDSCIVSGNFAPDSQGAGLYNDGSGSTAQLTILNTTISGNQALSTATLTAGGGIANDGSNGGSPTLTIVNSLVQNNLAEFDQSLFSSGNGGGIYNNGASATAEITNSIVNNNGVGHLPGGSGQTYGYGGGIWNSGVATIAGSTVNGNVAGHGGGIENSATLSITGSTVNNNTAGGEIVKKQWGEGGGIDSSSTLTITNTTLNGNFAYVQGGALNGNGMVTDSTISGNQSHNGGGIYGNPTITNSAISTNSVFKGNGDGGGIFGGGTIRHSTIAGNNADPGGGSIVVFGSLTIGNTILKTGTSGSNIELLSGTVTSNGYNISNDGGGGFLTGPGDQINTDPILGPLQDNGGTTFTHALLVGSPAIDAGDPNFTPPPYYDQRGPGFDRVRNGRLDVGSFEVQEPLATPTPTATATVTPTPAPTATPKATSTPRFNPTPRSRPSPPPRP